MTPAQQNRAIILLERAYGQLSVLNDSEQLKTCAELLSDIDKFTEEVNIGSTLPLSK